MKSKLLYAGEQKTWAVVFDRGDEVMAGLKKFAVENHLSASSLTAIGAFDELVLGFFVLKKKSYDKIYLREQLEVLSLLGDIALNGSEPQIHAHVVVGKIDGTAHGGHLIEGHVQPTLEVIVTESPRHLQRKLDPAIGLALIDLAT